MAINPLGDIVSYDDGTGQRSSAKLTIGGPGENHLGELGGSTAIAVGSFTRPSDTTAYAIGDLVANATSAGAVTPIALTVARVQSGSGRIPRVRLTKSGASITNAVFRAHLFRSSPVAANGDNGAFSTNQALSYIGGFDISMDYQFTDGAKGFGVPVVGPYVTFDCASGLQSIYALIEARAAYVPSSAETFTLAVEADRD